MELRAGFSLSDIEKLDNEMDVVKRIALRETIKEEEQTRRKLVLNDIISIVDGVYFANACTVNKKNFSMFNRWRNKLVKLITRSKEEPTLWDKISNKARRIQ